MKVKFNIIMYEVKCILLALNCILSLMDNNSIHHFSNRNIVMKINDLYLIYSIVLLSRKGNKKKDRNF